MHESASGPDAGVTALAGLIRALRHLPAAGDDAARVDRIRLLEELKSAAAAVQAQETARFAASQRQAQLDAGVPAERADGASPRRSGWLAASRRSRRAATWGGPRSSPPNCPRRTPCSLPAGRPSGGP